MAMIDVVVPDSLAEWFRLSTEMERAEIAAYPDTSEPPTLDQQYALEQIERVYYPQIEEAWESAPWMDRRRLDWRMLKQAWRDRHDEHGLKP